MEGVLVSAQEEYFQQMLLLESRNRYNGPTVRERREGGRESECVNRFETERGRERAQHFIVASSAEVFMS